MGKKKRKRKKRTTSNRNPRRNEHNFLTLSVITGPRDFSKAEAYLRKVMAYEDWLMSGKPPDGLPEIVESIPREYHQFFDRWPEGFSFYRDSLANYLERVLNRWPWHANIRSILRRAEASDPQSAQEFYTVATDAAGQFATQLNRAHATMYDSGALTSDDSRLRTMLRSYCDVYEVRFVLWFVGALAMASKINRLDAACFGGPDSSTNRGSLVSQVLSAISGSPLQQVFEAAYIDELRNAVSHNDYEILRDNGDISGIRANRTGVEWTLDEIYDTIGAAFHLSNSVHAAAAHAAQHWDARISGEYKQLGIVDALFSDKGEDRITIYIMQLWCFHELDTLGAWIDEGITVLTINPDESMSLSFGSGGTSGSSPPASILDKLSSGWVEIVRVPVAPDLGLGHPSYTAGERSFEVIGVPDSHIVPVEIR